MKTYKETLIEVTNTYEGKLIEFLEKCRSKGYTNMKDSTQSLKAKVIASDLGLSIKNISKLYDDAQALFAQRQAAQNHHAIDGDLICTLNCSSCKVNIYRRPDDTVYCCEDGKSEKYDNVVVTVIKSGVVSFNYHPSQMIYTGASSGGVTMGGFHETKAYYTSNYSTNDKASIVVRYNNTQQTVRTAKFSEPVEKAFACDGIYQKFNSGIIECRDTSSDRFADSRMQLLANQNNAYDVMKTVSVFNNMDSFSAAKCYEIADLLNRAIHHNYPPTADEVYKTAVTCSEKDTTASQRSACELFKLIPDYKNSQALKKKAEKRLEELIEIEKEQAILKKEADIKHMKKTAVIGSIAILIFLLFVFVIFPFIGKLITKSKAYKLYDSCDYVGAYELFAEVTNFSSVERLMRTDDNLLEVRNAKLAVGNTVKFGHYEQDDRSINGKEPVEWIVLANEDDQAILISKYALDGVDYYGLREWMNTFYDTAFNKTEKNALQAKETKYRSSNDSDYTVNDKVFALSSSEVRKYYDIPSDPVHNFSWGSKDLIAQGTIYGCSKEHYQTRIHAIYEDKKCEWWLSSGYISRYTGDIMGANKHDKNYHYGTRPSICLPLDSSVYYVIH